LYLISVRQLAGKWRLLIILGLAALPVITTFAATVSGDRPRQSEFDDVLLNGFFAAAILPLIVLAVATAAFGNELEDRTLSNLTLTPVPRWQIVVPKLLAAISVSAPLLLASNVIAVSMAYEGDSQVLVASAIAVVVAIATYSTVFLWLGMISNRALGFGLLYVFLWEGLFSNFVSGIRFLSIREYMLGIIRGLDNDRFAQNADEILSFGVSVAATLIVFSVFLALSIRRLRTMDIP
jgi:ABC-2 type transport system permease protein